MFNDLLLELEFYYKTDEDAIEGIKELKSILGRNSNEFDGMCFSRKHNKVVGGKYYNLYSSNDFMGALLIRINEILERFQDKFPTKWNSFYMSFTTIYKRPEDPWWHKNREELEVNK